MPDKGYQRHNETAKALFDLAWAQSVEDWPGASALVHRKAVLARLKAALLMAEAESLYTVAGLCQRCRDDMAKEKR